MNTNIRFVPAKVNVLTRMPPTGGSLNSNNQPVSKAPAIRAINTRK